MSRAYLLAGVACVSWLFAVGCKEEEPVEYIRPVRAMKVADAESFDDAPFPGRAKATQEVNIAFEVPGRLTERPVDVGSEVKEGDLLARLDPRDYQNNLDAAIARNDQAQAYRDRIAEAAKTGAVAQQELTDAEARLDVAKAEVKIAQKALDDTQIRAPFDGIVVATYLENFQNVLAKQNVIRMVDSSKIEMWINIPEQYISLAPYATDIRVEFDAFPGREIPAEIKEIGTEASERTRTYPVNLIMDQPEDITILPGMAGSARGRVETEEGARDAGYEVPLASVFADEQDTSYVWVIDESSMTVTRREVTLGKLTPRGVLVQGLEPDLWIATAGVNTLTEGQQVKILDEAALFARAKGESR
jgi:RND family efflux transporter MFP subunit